MMSAMASSTKNKNGLPNFRQSLKYLRPHRAPLILGLVAAIGVSAFYTFSISSVVPLLKIVFADNETLVDWLHRSETQHRLGIVLAADLPEDPAGLVVTHISADSPNGDILQDGDRIEGLLDDKPGSYALMRLLAAHPNESAQAAVFRPSDNTTQAIELRLQPYRWWTGMLCRAAAVFPSGKDADSRLRTLGIVMASLVLITVMGGLCRLANEGLIALSVQRALHDLRSELAEHVLRLPMHWHGVQPPGDILGRFATDINKLEVGLTTLFGRAIREPMKVIGALTLTALFDWRLLIAAVLGLPIGLIVMGFFGKMVKRSQKRASETWGRLLDHLGEKIAGIRVVKAYGMQKREGARFDAEGRILTRAQTHIEIVDAVTKPALEVLAITAVSGFVMYGAVRVFNQELEPTMFFAALVCLAGVFDPVRKLGKVNNRLQAAEASARRLFELKDVRPEESSTHASTDELPPFANTIEFRNVSFAYPAHSEKLVVSNFCLTVKKGRTVALVGPNGSGKTTLISLLLRFYEPDEGSILFDGRPVAKYSLDSLRRRIGLVTQEAVVFAGAVRENIAYGAEDEIDDARVRRAAELAHVDDFIQTLSVKHEGIVTRGYDAFVSGRTLSGGQRQRLALARAIYRDPPILILDEATSQVDSESERKIQEAVEDVSRDRTTFIIAHRYSTIAHADVTVVLNEGRLVSYGKHAELIETCSFYKKLCRTQFTARA